VPLLDEGGAVGQPCQDWPINEACTRGIEPDPSQRTPDQAYAVSVATALLWRATAGIYGTCEATVRPCGRKCGQQWFQYWPVQTTRGEWINVTCGCEDSVCGCCTVSEVVLDGPVASITQVLIDGQVVDESTYRVDDSFRLTRVSPAEAWPMCQNLSSPSTEAGTFEIIYQRGITVPIDGQFALAALAAEILKACSGRACALPARVQQITRQGITADLINDVAFLRSGLFNIPDVDMWVTAVNPYNQRSSSSIYSPDLPKLRQVS
jgi:hypothetical protein